MPELYESQRDALDVVAAKPGVLNRSKIGSGKTAVTLAEIDELFGGKPQGIPLILVIAPNSARSVWEDHIPVWTPSIPFTMLDRKHRTQSWKRYLDSGGFYIMHPEALRLMPELQKVQWDMIVVDEAQGFKNRKAQRTKALKQLRTTYKRALTGTLIINRPDDAWSILHWLYPKEFRSYWRHFETFVAYTVDHFGYKHVIGARNTEAFKELIAPFTIFVDSRAGAPEKFYTKVKIDLYPEQRRAYNEMRKDALAWVGEYPEEQPIPAPVAVARLTRQRQFACAYARVDEAGHVQLAEPSAKLDALVEILQSTDEKVVVFSQFRQMIDLACARLDKESIPHVVHTGAQNDVDRALSRGAFIDVPEVRVFLATMQTGGTGVDGLQRASSTMVFLDRSWSPADNEQAEGRLLRDGQTEPVEVILLTARDTVDEQVEGKLQWKASMIRKILGGE